MKKNPEERLLNARLHLEMAKMRLKHLDSDNVDKDIRSPIDRAIKEVDEMLPDDDYGDEEEEDDNEELQVFW